MLYAPSVSVLITTLLGLVITFQMFLLYEWQRIVNSLQMEGRWRSEVVKVEGESFDVKIPFK